MNKSTGYKGTMASSNAGEMYRYGIKFANDYDATMFALRWQR